jgi:hypothetical protein
MPSVESKTQQANDTAQSSSAAPPDALHDPLAGDAPGNAEGVAAFHSLVDPLVAPPNGPPQADNRTGMPAPLKANIESMSGMDMGDVRVHRNSAKPAAVEAHAYAQDSAIHLASGQEKHLPHEAWHVVQQKQGRVAPTRQLKGFGVNDSSSLEREADVMGNRAASSSAVATHSQAPTQQATPTGGVAQLRGENPYAKAVDHKGWTTTAHHIVAHSQLGKAFGKLSPVRQKEVLKAAIPATLTKDMVDNLKCSIADSVPARAVLRTQLASEDDDAVVVGAATLGAMRSSFFEWQGGNQFQGPNTSIRAEPGTDKDGMDLDGSHFNGMDDDAFSALTAIGTALPGLTNSEEDQVKITKHLTDMLALTKDKPVEAFDAGKWTEVTDPAEVATLATNVVLKRAHIEDYAFLTAALTDLGVDQTYSKVLPVGGGDYTYDNLPIKGFQTKGTQAYLPIGDAKALAPTSDVVTPLSELLTLLRAVMTEPDANNVLITPSATIRDVGKNKFTVGDFPDQIPFRPEDGKFKANKKLIANKKLTVSSQGTSLYDYAVGKGMGTSTYLPKALYDTLT